ncbi:MAG: peroxidase [Acidimicrobiia bacterium]
MSFLRTVSEDEATGDVAELYETDIERVGYLHNYIRTFSLHPAAYQAWRGLVSAIAKSMDERRYELATFSAANRLRSSYCSLAHGQVLVDKFLEPSVVEVLVEDPGSAGLDDADTLIVQFAAKVAEDASVISQGDIDRLRDAGLSDRDILDVVLAAAARCFFSKVLDATGTLPDSIYNEMEPELRDVLTVGRPIAKDL